MLTIRYLSGNWANLDYAPQKRVQVVRLRFTRRWRADTSPPFLPRIKKTRSIILDTRVNDDRS